MKSILALLLCLNASLAAADRLRLAVTTSFQNSGLADVVLEAVAEDIGLEIDLLVVGTGQALRLGRAGDVDAILVHSTKAEQEFVAQGFAPYRRDVMYNDFVIVGPEDDPAGLGFATDTASAFQALAQANAPFVSRGDDSGTHRKERALWANIGVAPETFGAWYLEVGAGMGASLNTAVGLGAYIITDRASWLNFGNKQSLTIVFEGDEDLFNQYGFLPVNLDRHAHVNAKSVLRFESWLASEQARDVINGYQIDDTAVFVYNYQH